MKCFRRSTRSFASGSLLLLLVIAPVYGDATGMPPTSRAAVVAAVEGAVRSRLGRRANVSVLEIADLRLDEQPGSLVAVPEPAARIGQPARFVISAMGPGGSRARVGEVTVRLRASVDAVGTTQAVARGATLGRDTVSAREVDLDGRPIRPLPLLEEAIGARATRDLAPDVVLTRADIASAPLVRAGATVRASVRIGLVDLTVGAIAAQNGRRDEIIRVVNPGSRRVLHARVVDAGEVEVVDVR
jgi:flagella basal body P-ring formation protein FlgA